MENSEVKPQLENADLKQLSDEELLAEAKALKSHWLFTAFFIGFLAGIVLFSILVNGFGFLMLIPLWMIHKFAQDPKSARAKEIDRILKEKGLKK